MAATSTSTLALVLLLVAAASVRGDADYGDLLSSRPAHTTDDFDCAVRGAAYEFAQKLQSWRGTDKMKEVFDSLELKTMCNQEFDASQFDPAPAAPSFPIPQDALRAYVDAGVDANQGDGLLNRENRPFATVPAALAAIRADRSAGRGSGAARAYVVLRQGTYRFLQTLELTASDSNVTFVNYPGEVATISGAKVLTTTWKPYNTEGGQNVYSADLSGQDVKSIPGLRVGGQRGARAGYPDRNPELSIFPDGWVHDKTAWATPKPPQTNVTYVTLDQPMLEDKTMFQQ